MKFFYEVTPTNENKTKTKTSGNFYVGILLEEWCHQWYIITIE